MADAAAAVTDAPKKAINFAEKNVLAFLLVVVLLAVLFVHLEAKTPGYVRNKVQKIPVIGPWATGVPNTPGT